MSSRPPRLNALRRLISGRFLLGAAVAFIPFAFICIFFLYPVGAIVWRGLAPDGQLDLSGLGEVLTNGEFRSILWFTFWQAAVSTILTLIVALPSAFVMSHYRFPGRGLLRVLITIPLILPAVVVGVAFLALAGPGGSLGVNLKGSIWIILFAHMFYNFAIVVRTVGGLWGHLDPRMEDAARMLGANRATTFRKVTLPLLRPAIAAAASIVFLFSFTSFGVVLILGGPRRVTLEVEIYRQTAQLLNLPVASALAIIQLVGVFTILNLYSRYQDRRSVSINLRPLNEVERKPNTVAGWAMVFGNLMVVVVFLLVPVGTLVKRSFTTPNGLGLDFYRRLSQTGGNSTLFIAPTEALKNSLIFAAIASVLALIIGGLAASVVGYGSSRASRSFDSLLMLPLGTSAVTVGFGYLISLNHGVLDLRSKPIIIPLAHTLVAIPFVIRVMVPIIRSIDGRLRESAATLGASPVRVWREIDLPIVAKAGLVGAGFAAAVSLGEFGATTFIVRPDTPTLPIYIFKLLSRPGAANFGMAMAMAVVLMVVTALVMVGVEKFRVGDVGEF